MKIESFKDLQKLIQLCRKTGIEAIEIDNVKMNLGPTPTIVSNTRQKVSQVANETQPVFTPGGITEEIQIPTNGLTDEQLLFYSAQGHEPQQ
jgi:hypothetical protein